MRQARIRHVGLLFGVTMNTRGLSLLELILAMAMVGLVLLAITTLNLLSLGSTAGTHQDAKMQSELMYVFRDMGLYLPDGISGGELTQYPDNEADIPSGDSKEGPIFRRAAANDGVWVGVLIGEDADAREVWYGYKFAAKKVVRKVYEPHSGAWADEEVLSGGILKPYADASDAALRTTCLNSVSDKTKCEDQGIYPVFQVSDQKTISASFSAEGAVPGAKKQATTAGMTKTFFVHSTAD